MKHIQIGYVVTTVNINSFKQSNCDPEPQDDEVIGQQQDAPEESHTQNCEKHMHNHTVKEIYMVDTLYYSNYSMYFAIP